MNETAATATTPTIRRRSAANRVGQMLSIVPWIAARDGPGIDDVCQRFGIGPGELIDDLNVVQFVGLPPYTPDMLIDVTFEGDRVWVRFAEVFARPLRLSPDQALALVAAGSALVASSEDPDEPSPLASGLAKLADLLGIDPADAIAIRLGASRPEVLDSLRRAVREQRRVRLDYFSYNRDRRTSREVDPYRVFASDGAWYVVGHCHLVDDTRTFRVDRIYRLDVLDEVFELSPSTELASAQAFALDPAAPRVVLDLPPDGRWVVDTYPADQVVEGPDGRLSVTLPVASRAWLERLLLRLGPDTRLVEVSDPALKASRAEAAARVLACYQDGFDR